MDGRQMIVGAEGGHDYDQLLQVAGDPQPVPQRHYGPPPQPGYPYPGSWPQRCN